VNAAPIIGAVGCALLTACTLQSAPPAERITVRSGWARMADSGATSGAYLDIVNNDTTTHSLIGVAADGVDAAEVHESTQHEGMSHMMPRTDLPIAPGATLTMQPGGIHVMLIGVRRRLSVGDSVRLQLRFSDSTVVSTSVPVRTP
jgi:copper(I)-binding protein